MDSIDSIRIMIGQKWGDCSGDGSIIFIGGFLMLFVGLRVNNMSSLSGVLREWIWLLKGLLYSIVYAFVALYLYGVVANIHL